MNTIMILEGELRARTYSDTLKHVFKNYLLELSYTVGGNANQYSHYGEQCGGSLKKLEIDLPYDPAIPLLGIHTEETRIERDSVPQCSLQHCL